MPIKQISVEGNQFSIKFHEIDDFQPVLSAVRDLPRRWFKSSQKLWLVPAYAWKEVEDFAAKHHFTIDDKAKKLLTKQLPAEEQRPKPQAIEPRPLNLNQPFGTRTLYEHQKRGIEWLIKAKKCILADDLGIGKTLQSLVAAKAFYPVPVYVICPASLLDNWKREAEEAEVFIRRVYSWAKLPDELVEPYILIADESAYAQGGVHTQRGKKFLELSARASAVFMLTGTPIKNGRPINFLPLLQAADHPLARDVRSYHIKFCNAHATPWSKWDVSGARNLDELHEKTKDVMLRRMKSECLDLPAKTRVLREVEASKAARDLYNQTFSELREKYHNRIASGEILSGGEALVMLNHLRHAASLAKVEAAIEIAEEIVEEQGAIVIFTGYVESAKRIQKHFNGLLLAGETPSSDRQALVDQFQQGKNPVFVATLGAGNVGITLTKAQTVILVDRPWTPGDAIQSEDRLHRIGQTQNVLAIWLQYDDTDRQVDKILTEKSERIELVLNGKRKTLRGTSSPQDLARQILTNIAE